MIKKKSSRPGSSLVFFLIVGVFGAIVLFNEFGTSNQGSQTTRDANESETPQIAIPVSPDPEYIWGLASGEASITLDQETVDDDNIVIVLDFSGSMTEASCEGDGAKANVALAALDSFLGTVPENVNLALIAFDDQGLRQVVPMGQRNAEQVREAVFELLPGGGTPLGPALEMAIDALETTSSPRLGNGSYKIVVITDGVANDETLVLQQVAWANLNTPITMYTAGFCIGEGHPLNLPGETVYAAANDLSGLLSVLEAAVAEAQDFTDGEGGFQPIGE